MSIKLGVAPGVCPLPRFAPGECAAPLGVAPGVSRMLLLALEVRHVLPVAPRVSLMLPVAPGVNFMLLLAPGGRRVLPVAPRVNLMLPVAPRVRSVGLHRASAPAAGVTGVRLAGTEPSADTEPSAGTSVRKTAR